MKESEECEGTALENSFIEHSNLSSSLSSNLSSETISFLESTAKAVVGLSIDMVQKANSGHPGLPMGLARLGSYLYGHFLRHYPLCPSWMARDRCILSAGHGSAWLYSLLHLSGYDLSLDELKNFRQKHSRTPGHPEYSLSEGIETTSGPLGQGLAHAVGAAIALKAQWARLDRSDVFAGSKVVAVAGDGCMMEGVQYEAMSLAGHLKLDNLIVCYDANEVCLDGPLNECMSENVAARAISQGWHVRYCNGKDFQSIHAVFSGLREEQNGPVLIIVRSEIGEGAPTKAGKSAAHGAPLGEDEALAAKKAWALSSNQPFWIDPCVKEQMAQRIKEQGQMYQKWQESFSQWRSAFPQKAEMLETMCAKMPSWEQVLCDNSALVQALLAKPMASRESSSLVLQEVAKYPFFIGGSADLSSSDKTWIKAESFISPSDYSPKNIKYGVREFAMAATACGIAQSGCFIPVIGTFLTFSDYMRGAIRLSALMQLQVVYQFTHDSVLLGEDGPTHQPIEQIMSLRMIPGLQVLRPADSFETLYAWKAALEYSGPTALILSRQKLPDLGISELPFEEATGRGAYQLASFGPQNSEVEVIFVATGSETSLSCSIAKKLADRENLQARVINMPSWTLFERQEASYRDALFDTKAQKALFVTVEAGVTAGWQKPILPYLLQGNRDYLAIGIDQFGCSAPENQVREEMGLNKESIFERIMARLKTES